MSGIRGDSGPAGRVFLTAFAADRSVVLEDRVNVDDYYGESHSMIDSDDFRQKHLIRFIHGEIFSHDGTLDQVFDNSYDAEGRYSHGRAVHADGTVIED